MTDENAAAPATGTALATAPAASSPLPARVGIQARVSALTKPIARGIAANLERAHISPARFEAVVAAAFAKNPKLWKADMVSLRTALLNCSSDGLVPDGRRALLTTYYDNKAKRDIAQYMPMVQGIIGRMRDMSDTISITCEVVYRGDAFEFDRSDPYSTKHRDGEDVERTDANIAFVYAIFRDKHRNIIHREIMSRADIDKTRKASKAANSPAWLNWFSEMCRKAVIRRGSKYVPMSEALRTIIEREDSLFDFEANAAASAAPEEYDPFEDETPALPAPDSEGEVEAEYEPVEEESPAAEEKPEPKPNVPGLTDIGTAMNDLRLELDGVTTKAEVLVIRDRYLAEAGPDAATGIARLVGQRIDAIAEKRGKK